MTNQCIRFIEGSKPDYGFIYAKLARHVAAADAHLTGNRTHAASEELIAALQAIQAFETTALLITTYQDTDDD